MVNKCMLLRSTRPQSEPYSFISFTTIPAVAILSWVQIKPTKNISAQAQQQYNTLQRLYQKIFTGPHNSRCFKAKYIHKAARHTQQNHYTVRKYRSSIQLQAQKYKGISKFLKQSGKRKPQQNNFICGTMISLRVSRLSRNKTTIWTVAQITWTWTNLHKGCSIRA